MGVIDFVFYFLGAGAMFGVGLTITSYRWHSVFHRNRARCLLLGHAVCVHCVQERMICLECERHPCLCAARREAQAWVADRDAETSRE